MVAARHDQADFGIFGFRRLRRRITKDRLKIDA